MMPTTEDAVQLVECLPRILEALDCIQPGYMRLCLKKGKTEGAQVLEALFTHPEFVHT